MLRFGTVCGLLPSAGRVLRTARRNALETFEDMLDTPRHQDFANAFIAIPLKSQATALFGVPVDAADVQFFKG